MERWFYGTAIQGALDRGERAYINQTVIQLIKALGKDVVSTHTIGRNKQETGQILEAEFGTMPLSKTERSRYIRRRLLNEIDGDISGAIFEMSIPSQGTTVELDWSLSRPARSKPAIPILGLYQKDYWPSGLSTMIAGIDPEEYPNYHFCEYQDLGDLGIVVVKFIKLKHL